MYTLNTLCYNFLQENRFTKCDTCTAIKSEKEKTMDAVKIKQLNDMMEEHNKLQMLVYIRNCLSFTKTVLHNCVYSMRKYQFYNVNMEICHFTTTSLTHKISFCSCNRDQRRRYHCIRDKAETDPSIVSIIIDGMDQNSTNLPHCKRLQKSDSNRWHFRTHVTGTHLFV